MTICDHYHDHSHGTDGHVLRTFKKFHYIFLLLQKIVINYKFWISKINGFILRMLEQNKEDFKKILKMITWPKE